MSAINLNNAPDPVTPGKVVNNPPPKVFSQGKVSTIPGRPSAAQILQQIEVVNGMLTENNAALGSRELQEDRTPSEDVTPVELAKTKILRHEIARLERAREYWKRTLNEELERLKKSGAVEKLLPAYQGDPSTRYWRDHPEDLGITPPDVYFDPDQTPPPPKNGCWMGNSLQGKARQDALQQEWDKYQSRLRYDREQYSMQLKRWAVDHALWEERRRKTMEKGKPFHDTPPAMPKMDVAIPNCPRPARSTPKRAPI